MKIDAPAATGTSISKKAEAQNRPAIRAAWEEPEDMAWMPGPMKVLMATMICSKMDMLWILFV